MSWLVVVRQCEAFAQNLGATPQTKVSITCAGTYLTGEAQTETTLRRRAATYRA
jgi:hypothetical protein